MKSINKSFSWAKSKLPATAKQLGWLFFIGTITNLPVYYALYQTKQEVAKLKTVQEEQITEMSGLCTNAVETFDLFMLACKYHGGRKQ